MARIKAAAMVMGILLAIPFAVVGLVCMVIISYLLPREMQQEIVQQVIKDLL